MGHGPDLTAGGIEESLEDFQKEGEKEALQSTCSIALSSLSVHTPGAYGK